MKQPKIYYKDDNNRVEIKILRHNAEHDTFLIKFPNERIVECAPKELIFPTDVEIKDYYTSVTSHVHVINPETVNTQPYYKGKDSLYKFAEEWGLNSYEFDIIKRLVRCRHKGNFVEDLNKTKDLIDIYLKEYKTK